ncbi:MAG: Cation-binding protein [Candidatus Thorarchaeota archaeon]|nr:MAG: Cation-binding protein [Candidatus Thorarchaeota archaeon]
MVQPIGPLMIEHRLIERMIAVMEKEIERIEADNTANPNFIEIAVDFIRTYADRCHHGKEEDILFRDLKKKDLTDEDQALMDELIQEHILGRKLTQELVDAKERYVSGTDEAIISIVDVMRQLVEFYPQHIEKEDKVFFKAAMKYFSREEMDLMLEEEYKFDRELIHYVFEDKVEEVESSHE